VARAGGYQVPQIQIEAANSILVTGNLVLVRIGYARYMRRVAIEVIACANHHACLCMRCSSHQQYVSMLVAVAVRKAAWWECGLHFRSIKKTKKQLTFFR
jgi:hypothetical protein